MSKFIENNIEGIIAMIGTPIVIAFIFWGGPHYFLYIERMIGEEKRLEAQVKQQIRLEEARVEAEVIMIIADAEARGERIYIPPVLERVVVLEVPAGAHEAVWADALAAVWGGEREVVVDGGRVDVVTAALAVEVGRAATWHEDLGQALHYGHELERLAVVAVIVEGESDLERVRKLREVAASARVQVVVLRSR